MVYMKLQFKDYVSKLIKRFSIIIVEVDSEIFDCYLWIKIKDYIYIYLRFWDICEIIIQNFRF